MCVGWDCTNAPKGAPLNPAGRTGLRGRGLLGKWGPNYAADPVVTRMVKDKVEVVVIKRKDTGDWAIPGGMVDDGEVVSVTVKREFKEEAVNLTNPDERAEVEQMLEQLFKEEAQPRHAEPRRGGGGGGAAPRAQCVAHELDVGGLPAA